MSLIHWRHPVKGGAACGTVGFGIYVQADFQGTISARDPTIINVDKVPMTVNCKRCVAIHERWLEGEMRKLQSLLPRTT